MTIETAIETFVTGFSFTRSFTHPCIAERVGAAWVMRDAPRRSGARRSEEWVAHGLAPEDLVGLVRQHAHGAYRLCVVRATDEPDTQIRESYRRLGFRLNTTEAFMVQPLESVPNAHGSLPVRRITTTGEADLVARAAGRRQVLPEHLGAEPSPLRLYCAFAGGTPVGWVGSVAAGEAAWCANLYVEPAHRRRGVARALLARMLADDRAAGASASVLLASKAGARLYPTVGYLPIGELFVYTAPESARPNTLQPDP